MAAVCAVMLGVSVCFYYTLTWVGTFGHRALNVRNARNCGLLVYSTRADQRLDPLRCLGRVLVLPDAYNLPPSLGEHLIDPGISSAVRVNFFGPEFRVPSCWAMMIWASMPVAPVYEYSYSSSGEDNISRVPCIRNGARRYSVPEPKRMQL